MQPYVIKFFHYDLHNEFEIFQLNSKAIQIYELKQELRLRDEGVGKNLPRSHFLRFFVLLSFKKLIIKFF